MQISGGGRAGKSGWYFHQTQSIFSGSRQMSPNKFFSTTRSSSDSRLFLIVGNQQIPSKSSLFLVRVGYCGDLHGTFASSSQTTTASTPTVKRKIKSDYFWLPGIFSRLLSRLNYDEEEMMANMGGSRLYRSVWFKTNILT